MCTVSCSNLALEDPVTGEILVSYPLGVLGSVSPFRPSPECPPDLVVDLLEDLLADHVAMIVDPSPDERVELMDQISGGGSGG